MAENPEPGEALVPAREVARRLSVAVRTLYRMVRRGDVPQPIRLNRKLVRWRTRRHRSLPARPGRHDRMTGTDLFRLDPGCICGHRG